MHTTAVLARLQVLNAKKKCKNLPGTTNALKEFLRLIFEHIALQTVCK